MRKFRLITIHFFLAIISIKPCEIKAQSVVSGSNFYWEYVCEFSVTAQIIHNGKPISEKQIINSTVWEKLSKTKQAIKYTGSVDDLFESEIHVIYDSDAFLTDMEIIYPKAPNILNDAIKDSLIRPYLELQLKNLFKYIDENYSKLLALDRGDECIERAVAVALVSFREAKLFKISQVHERLRMLLQPMTYDAPITNFIEYRKENTPNYFIEIGGNYAGYEPKVSSGQVLDTFGFRGAFQHPPISARFLGRLFKPNIYYSLGLHSTGFNFYTISDSVNEQTKGFSLLYSDLSIGITSPTERFFFGGEIGTSTNFITKYDFNDVNKKYVKKSTYFHSVSLPYLKISGGLWINNARITCSLTLLTNYLYIKDAEDLKFANGFNAFVTLVLPIHYKKVYYYKNLKFMICKP